MDLYIEIQGGICQSIYRIGQGNEPVVVHILDFDDNPELIPPPIENRIEIY